MKGYFWQDDLLAFRLFVFDSRLQFLDDFLIVTWSILIEIFINLCLIDGYCILSFKNDVEVKGLRVLLAHKMTVRNDDVCALFEILI